MRLQPLQAKHNVGGVKMGKDRLTDSEIRWSVEFVEFELIGDYKPRSLFPV